MKRSILTLPVLFGIAALFATAQAADVRIDVRPGSSRNVVNPHSNGVVPVALLGSADFDVNSVTVSGLGLSAQGSASSAQPKGQAHFKDVNGDGYQDVIMNFSIRDTGVKIGDTQLCLAGSGFVACDNIETVPNR